MISPSVFYQTLKEHGVHFFSGVPDSLLKEFLSVLDLNESAKTHIVAPHEGNAVALAAGYFFATGRVPFVYMQNSGLGNCVNPLTSLTNKDVYSIPMLLLIGHRGREGSGDEPQHKKMGEITLELLRALDIPAYYLPENEDESIQALSEAVQKTMALQAPVALIARENLFKKMDTARESTSSFPHTQKEALELLLENFSPDSLYFLTTGHIGRIAYEIAARKELPLGNFFLNLGSMGHNSHIALAHSLFSKQRTVCIDGDGALLMHMGGLVSLAQTAPINFKYIVLNNGAHGSVGAQKTMMDAVNLPALARACGFPVAHSFDGLDAFAQFWRKPCEGPVFLEIKVNASTEQKLPRPKRDTFGTPEQRRNSLPFRAN